MKEIKIEKKSYDIKWEAIDGTQFYSEEECKKYEESAVMVLWARFLKLVVAKHNEYNLFGVGCDDSTVYAIKMNTQDDMNVVMQLYLLDNPWLLKAQNGEQLKNRAFSLIDKAYRDNDILFVGQNCEDCIYIIDSRQSFFERLENLDKEEPEDA